MVVRPTRLAVVMALAAAAAPLVAHAATHVRPTPEQRRVVFRPHGATHQLPPPVVPKAGQADIDVLDYDLRITLDTATETIRARCVVTFVPAAGATVSTLPLDLHDATLDVTGVERLDLGVAARFSHAADELLVTLDPPVVDPGVPVRVAVDYGGRPLELAFGILTFATHGTEDRPVVYTLSEPFMARGWFPCKDRPDDKATLTMRIEAPSDLVAVSNGRHVSTEPSTGLPGYSVTTWRESYPITTYLVSLAVSNYEVISETYSGLDGLARMPVQHWVYPELRAAAERHFAPTIDMTRFFAERFNEYPFLEEKYGHAVIPLGGAMEHQTATSYGAEIVAGGDGYQFVVAHELAHQWFGDHVSPKTFDSLWLNEGFASYAEALWAEHVSGAAAYRGDLRDKDIQRFPPYRDFLGTVHAPPVSDPEEYFDWSSYGSTVYYKGAWVLHMLRWVMGQPGVAPPPERVTEVMRAWDSAYGSRSAETADFESVATAMAPATLPPLDQWFFPQWLHRSGRPRYEWGWSAAPLASGGVRVHVRVRQAQPGDLFVMPLELRWTTPTGTESRVVWNDASLADYTFELAEAPTELKLDPDDWVLKSAAFVSIDADGDGWPDWLDGCPEVPNPLQEDENGNGTQDACEPGIDYDGDGVVNQGDCAPADGDAWSVEDALIRVSHVGRSSTVTVTFADPGGQREYVADHVGGSLGELRDDRSFARSYCVAKGLAGPLVDDVPALAGGTWYVAVPYNGCAGTMPDGGPDPCR